MLPCIKAVGKKDSKIVLVGEAPGQQEEMSGAPFMGYDGQELDRMLKDAGIQRHECYLTNVLWTRPPQNKFDLFCVKKAELPLGYSLPAVSQGKYLHPNFLPELDRLYGELAEVKPNLIVALGAKALWALTGRSNIGAMRGTVCETPYGKCLPTYHPSAVNRDWSLRPTVVIDLMKAERERKFPNIVRPKRLIINRPSLADIIAFYHRHKNAKYLAADIETKNGQITMIGFAPSKDEALVVPFYNPDNKRSYSHWPDAESEKQAWLWVGKFLTLSAGKIFQNGLFDLQYLFRFGFRVVNACEDTLLMHHALFPEKPKSLGFMGSIYTDEPAWKLMRKKEGDKKDD